MYDISKNNFFQIAVHNRVANFKKIRILNVRYFTFWESFLFKDNYISKNELFQDSLIINIIDELPFIISFLKKKLMKL